jgi:hypothetical protein
MNYAGLTAVNARSNQARTRPSFNTSHLTRDGQTTLCGLQVAHAIRHLCRVEQAYSCRNCRRALETGR